MVQIVTNLIPDFLKNILLNFSIHRFKIFKARLYVYLSERGKQRSVWRIFEALDGVRQLFLPYLLKYRIEFALLRVVGRGRFLLALATFTRLDIVSRRRRRSSDLCHRSHIAGTTTIINCARYSSLFETKQ